MILYIIRSMSVYIYQQILAPSPSGKIEKPPLANLGENVEISKNFHKHP